MLLSWHFDSIQFLDRPLEFLEFRSGFCELAVGSQTSIIGERLVGALDQRANGAGVPDVVVVGVSADGASLGAVIEPLPRPSSKSRRASSNVVAYASLS